MTPWTIAHQAPLSMEILQASILDQVAMPSSKGFSKPRDWTQVSGIAGGFFTIWATSKAHDTYINHKKKITGQCYSLIIFICKFRFLILLVSRYWQSIPHQTWWNNVRGKILIESNMYFRKLFWKENAWTVLALNLFFSEFKALIWVTLKWEIHNKTCQTLLL